jgi:CBS domain-containing protein
MAERMNDPCPVVHPFVQAAKRLAIFQDLKHSREYHHMRTTGTIGGVLAQKGFEIYAVSQDATVFEAITIMADKNVGALLVMKGDELVGIVSERDYTRKVALKGKSSKQVHVLEIMTASPRTVTPGHTVEECLRIMTENRVRHLPVMDKGKVIGVVSIGNLVNWVISSQSATIDHLENYISGKYPG